MTVQSVALESGDLATWVSASAQVLALLAIAVTGWTAWSLHRIEKSRDEERRKAEEQARSAHG